MENTDSIQCHDGFYPFFLQLRYYLAFAKKNYGIIRLYDFRQTIPIPYPVFIVYH